MFASVGAAFAGQPASDDAANSADINMNLCMMICCLVDFETSGASLTDSPYQPGNSADMELYVLKSSQATGGARPPAVWICAITCSFV